MCSGYFLFSQFLFSHTIINGLFFYSETLVTEDPRLSQNCHGSDFTMINWSSFPCCHGLIVRPLMLPCTFSTEREEENFVTLLNIASMLELGFDFAAPIDSPKLHPSICVSCGAPPDENLR